jgi:vacuolar-type H+-ATPase subunit C/Vma6
MSFAITEQIEQTMGFHPGNKDVANVYAELRERFRELATHVNKVCPDGRVKSLAITHLEDALMSAIQAIAVEQPLGPERI